MNRLKTTLLVSILMFATAPSLRAQARTECDTTIMVDQRLTTRINVGEWLSDWIRPGLATSLLFGGGEIINKSETTRNLVRSYPSMLRDHGKGGSVLVAIYIDTLGVTKIARVVVASEFPELDAGAKSVAERMRFKPVRLDSGCAVPAVLQIPVTYNAR